MRLSFSMLFLLMLTFSINISAATLDPSSQQPASTNIVTISEQVDPKDLLRNAHSINVQSQSVYFNAGTLENALLKNSKFKKMGLTLTNEYGEADIIIEVNRVIFTPVFTFRAIDRRTKTIVATGKATSIIGVRLLRSASGSMASQFLDQIGKARK